MEPQEKLTTQQYIIDRLHDIQRKAESNNYTDALNSIKEVKVADTKNIYLIAIEKQIAKLEDPATPPENRTGIIQSLPAMIDRAISDIQRRNAVPKVDEGQKEQKEAALEKLKSQYFQRADDYVEKQEYQRALEEIRRIYIIEPGSVVAKEYEQKIEHLASLQAHGEKAEKEIAAGENKESVSGATGTGEKVELILEEEPKKSRLPLIIAVAVVVISSIVWFFLMRSSGDNQQPTPNTTEQPSPAVTTETQPAAAATTNPQPEKPITTKPASAAESSSKQPPKTSKTTPEIKTTTVTAPVKTPPREEKKQPAPVVTQPQPTPEQVKTPESEIPTVFVAQESRPEVTHLEPPVYPEMAIKLGIQGRVVVEVTIDPQGKPIQTKIVKSASDVFNDAAVEAAMKSTYKPGMMSNGPVTSKLLVPFDFRIKNR